MSVSTAAAAFCMLAAPIPLHLRLNIVDIPGPSPPGGLDADRV